MLNSNMWLLVSKNLFSWGKMKNEVMKYLTHSKKNNSKSRQHPSERDVGKAMRSDKSRREWSGAAPWRLIVS